MRRKQGRLKPGGQHLNPTGAGANSADKGDKDTNASDKDSNMTNKGEEERDKDTVNKDASSLVKASSAENGSSGSDKPQGKQGKTERESSTGINGSTSEDPDVLPQVCLGLYPLSNSQTFLFRPFVGLVVVLGTPVTCSRFSSNLSVQGAGDQR